VDSDSELAGHAGNANNIKAFCARFTGVSAVSTAMLRPTIEMKANPRILVQAYKVAAPRALIRPQGVCVKRASPWELAQYSIGEGRNFLLVTLRRICEGRNFLLAVLRRIWCTVMICRADRR
jgi:hypothetical protein